jgi:hypothetical protein
MRRHATIAGPKLFRNAFAPSSLTSPYEPPSQDAAAEVAFVGAKGFVAMSLDIRSHLPLAVDATADEEAQKRMQRIEIALMAGAACIAVVLFSVASVLIHLS